MLLGFFKAYFPVRIFSRYMEVYIDSDPYVDVIGVHSEEMKEVTEKDRWSVSKKSVKI